MIKQISSLLLILLLSTINSFSQPGMTPDSSTISAMNRVSFLEGNWVGKGWIQKGMEKHHFSQKETVIQKVNNTVIVIDGKGIDAETNQVIHQAFAVISFDTEKNKYLMRAFKVDGNYIDAEASVDGNGDFIWGFTLPQTGQIRYTIKLEDDKWVEIGEMNGDGHNWFQFFGMTLSRE